MFRILIGGEVARTGLDGRVLVAVFDGGEPPCAVAVEWAADRSAILFAIERRRGQVAVEGGGQRLKIAVALK